MLLQELADVDRSSVRIATHQNLVRNTQQGLIGRYNESSIGTGQIYELK